MAKGKLEYVFTPRGLNIVKGRNGKEYVYHRASGDRIPDEILKDPQALAKRLGELEVKRPSKALAGTLGRLIEQYKASPEFAALKESSKGDYLEVLDWLTTDNRTATPLRLIDAGWVYRTRDAAMEAHGRKFANLTLAVLKRIWNWGRERGLAPLTNPVRDVAMLPRPKHMPPANRPWTMSELRTVMAEAKGGLKLAIAIGSNTGLREMDVLTLPWSAYNGTAINLRQGKTGEPLWLTVTAELKAALDAAPRRSPVIVLSNWGRPFTDKGFQGAFRKLIARLEREGRVGKGLTFHGLRHTVGNVLAEAGQETWTIAAVLGQRSLRMAEHYSRHAKRMRQAAAGVAVLEREMNEIAKHPG